jgi:hypothetical protein
LRMVVTPQSRFLDVSMATAHVSGDPQLYF